MSKINVIVATKDPPEVQAETFAELVDARQDMNLVEGRCVSNKEADNILSSGTGPTPGALVLVGRPNETDELERKWLAARNDLIVMRIVVIGDIVRIGLRPLKVHPLLTALRV